MKSGICISSRRAAKTPLTFAITAILLAGGSAATATGDTGRAVSVSGNGIPSYTCGLEGSDYALQMTGDLEGCLSVFVRGFKCKEFDDYDLYSERGREVFVGTLKGKRGRFRTNYTFEGAYSKGFCQDFDFTREVGGGCDHRITGKSGVFDGAVGRIKFIDVITNVTGNPTTGEFTPGTGLNNALYHGYIRLR